MPDIKNNSKSYFILVSTSHTPHPLCKGYDPEMVYVECGRCGAPIMWERGKTTTLCRAAGIDPLELDPTCVLISDGCPVCSKRGSYNLQICRIRQAPSCLTPVTQGHA